jgi:hypothetical protein
MVVSKKKKRIRTASNIVAIFIPTDDRHEHLRKLLAQQNQYEITVQNFAFRKKKGGKNRY